jgi:hypothetical protein
MQKNFAMISVFILSAVLVRGIMYCAEGNRANGEILSFAFIIICSILLILRHPVHREECTFNKRTLNTPALRELPVISTRNSKRTTGSHQQ